MFREPFEPLPYLFFHGPENSGKSIFHEALALLVTRGVVRADRALSNNNDFNGELENAILCVVEERDLSKDVAARNKMKDWVTSKTIAIRKMRMDQFCQPNATHWVQAANSRSFCPIFPGDTRIVTCFVGSLPAGAEIPKRELLKRLEAEAPSFMRTIVDVDLPSADGRLRLPVISTTSKQAAEYAAQSPLEEFLKGETKRVDGAVIPLDEFNRRYADSLPPNEQTVFKKFDKTDFVTLAEPLETSRRANGRVLVGVCWATPA